MAFEQKTAVLPAGEMTYHVAGDGAPLLYLHGGGGRPLDRGKQHAPKTISDRMTKAALKRLYGKLAILFGLGLLLKDDRTGQLEITPTNSHGAFLLDLLGAQLNDELFLNGEREIVPLRQRDDLYYHRVRV